LVGVIAEVYTVVAIVIVYTDIVLFTSVVHAPEAERNG
jgi:hypothetical protein